MSQVFMLPGSLLPCMSRASEPYPATGPVEEETGGIQPLPRASEQLRKLYPFSSTMTRTNTGLRALSLLY